MYKATINKIHHQFPVIIENDETGGYVVTCPAFEGCYSQGETLDEAMENIKEAIELCLEEQKEPAFKLGSKLFGIHLVTV